MVNVLEPSFEKLEVNPPRIASIAVRMHIMAVNPKAIIPKVRKERILLDFKERHASCMYSIVPKNQNLNKYRMIMFV